jgi:hypothetical protein
MVKYGKRRVGALLSVVTLAVLGASAPASAATGTGGLPILYAGEGNTAHQCTVIGSADGYQGVVCADILTGTTATEYWAEGRVEIICQKGSGSSAVDVQCAHVDTVGRVSNAAGGYDYVGQWACGQAEGPCSTGRNYVTTWAFDYSTASGCASNPNSSYDVWMIALGNYETGSPTGIELPVSGKWVYLGTGNANDGTNESSGHYYICA